MKSDELQRRRFGISKADLKTFTVLPGQGFDKSRPWCPGKLAKTCANDYKLCTTCGARTLTEWINYEKR